MGEGFLGKAIKRAGRNCIFIGVGGLAIVVLLFSAARGYFYNFLHGPFPIDRAQLLSNQNPGDRRESFVTVQVQETIDTGFEESSIDYFITTHHPFLASKIGDRLLLIKASKESTATQFSGEITSVPSDVQNQVLAVLQQKYPDLKGRFLPVMLDATSYRLNGYLGIAAGTLFGLGLLWCLWKGLNWSAKPETHHVWKKLALYGPAEQVGSQLDAELRSEGGGETFGNAHVTTNWLVHSSAYDVHVMRLTDVVWAYPQVIKHYHSGIPTGKSHFVKVFDRPGSLITVSVKKNIGPNLLLALQRRSPWAIYGFTADLEQMWKKRRPEFLQTVDQQKKRIQPSSAATKPAVDKKDLVRV
jgi:hypothetical protein